MGFWSTLTGITPVFMLIALGYGLKKSGFLPLNVWGPIEKFAVYVLYPGFLVPAIWHANLSGASAGAVGLSVLGAALISTLLALSLRPVLKVTGPTYTSVFQGLIRFNTFVFIPVATTLFGEGVMNMAAVGLSVLIPTTNFIAIVVLAKWGEPVGGKTHDGSLISLLWVVIRNPIFAACMLGLALNFLKVPPTPVFDAFLQSLGEAAIPTGLILAGAGLSFAYVAARPWLVSAVSVYKILIMPLIAWGLCYLLGGDQLAQGVAMMIGAAPSAAAAYVLARHMGGDATFMAGVVAITTTASAVTMPLLLWVFYLVS